MNRPLLAAICLALAVLALPGCASRMALPDEAEAWGFEPVAFSR